MKEFGLSVHKKNTIIPLLLSWRVNIPIAISLFEMNLISSSYYSHPSDSYAILEADHIFLLECSPIIQPFAY